MDVVIDYETFLKPFLGAGFSYDEIVVPGSHAHAMPPKEMWENIEPALKAANKIRDIMRQKHGAKGLRVNAAYRPTGGASNSQHKHNRALDLDLLPGDYNLTREYYEEAVRYWYEHHDERMGLGLYCPGDACQGIRIHIDFGFYTRTWQHGARPGKADTFIIADRLGLRHASIVNDESSDAP